VQAPPAAVTQQATGLPKVTTYTPLRRLCVGV